MRRLCWYVSDFKPPNFKIQLLTEFQTALRAAAKRTTSSQAQTHTNREWERCEFHTWMDRQWFVLRAAGNAGYGMTYGNGTDAYGFSCSQFLQCEAWIFMLFCLFNVSIR